MTQRYNIKEISFHKFLLEAISVFVKFWEKIQKKSEKLEKFGKMREMFFKWPFFMKKSLSFGKIPECLANFGLSFGKIWLSLENSREKKPDNQIRLYQISFFMNTVNDE